METPATNDSSQPVLEFPEGEDIPRRDPSEIIGYNRTKRRLHLLGVALSLIYWVVSAMLADDFVAWLGLGEGLRWLGLAGVAVIMLGGSVLVNLPLDYYDGYVVEQRYQLSNQTVKDWLVFQLKSWLVGGIIGGIVLAGLYGALWYAGPWWSVYVWLGMMFLSVGLAKLFPLVILPLFYPSKPLERPSLGDRLTELAGEAGMTITGIFNLELSKETKKANAMLAGLGSSRRVYLSDTLLQAFSDDQIAVVFAHELGHHVRKHIWKNIGIAAVVTSLLVGLIHWRLGAFGGQSDSAVWPMAVAGLAEVMLIVTVFPLLSGIVTNAIMRRFERQCDSDALRMTGNQEAYRSAFEQLGQLNLNELEPPWWEVILFDDHPPLGERIAMADRLAEGALR